MCCRFPYKVQLFLFIGQSPSLSTLFPTPTISLYLTCIFSPTFFLDILTLYTFGASTLTYMCMLVFSTGRIIESRTVIHNMHLFTRCVFLAITLHILNICYSFISIHTISAFRYTSRKIICSMPSSPLFCLMWLFHFNYSIVTLF